MYTRLSCFIRRKPRETIGVKHDVRGRCHYVLSTNLATWAAFVLALVLTGSTAKASPVGLTIDQAVQEALSANLALAAQRHNIDIARAEIITATLRPNPELGVAAENLNRDLGNEETEYILGVEFEIEGLGKRKARIDHAEHLVTVVEHEFRDATRELILEVQYAALEVLLIQAKLNLAHDTLQIAESIGEMNEVRFLTGEIGGAELRRSRLFVPQARNAVYMLEVEYAAALREFNLLLGQSGDRYTVIDDFRTAEEAPSLPAMLELAYAQRPDLQASIAEQQRAASDLHLQYTERRPDFAVGTELRRFRGYGNYVGLTFSMPLPLFDRNQGEIARAQGEQYQADAQLRSLRAEIGGEVRSAHSRLERHVDILDGVEMELDEARQLRDIVEQSYRAGGASLLEVLDASAAFNEAMESYNEVRTRIAQDLYFFDYLSGVTVSHESHSN